MTKAFIILALTAAGLAGCQTRTVVYTSPSAPRSTTYVRTPSRVVTNTVYVNERNQHPTSLPGAATRVPEPGEPSNFPATTGQ